MAKFNWQRARQRDRDRRASRLATERRALFEAPEAYRRATGKPAFASRHHPTCAHCNVAMKRLPIVITRGPLTENGLTVLYFCSTNCADLSYRELHAYPAQTRSPVVVNHERSP